MSLNVYSSFKALLPKSPVTSVEVTTVLTNGNSQVRTSDGVTITVSGDSVNVGERAYIKDGAITGKAPNITTVRVNV
tara:strand:+ start:16652 stop:16882 length:231 start_codon:yes stop_codon:yes gene_type:complete